MGVLGLQPHLVVRVVRQGHHQLRLSALQVGAHAHLAHFVDIALPVIEGHGKGRGQKPIVHQAGDDPALGLLLDALEGHALRHPLGAARRQVNVHPLMGLFQPPGAGDVQRQGVAAGEVRALQPVGDHGRRVGVSAGDDAVGNGTEALPVLVFQIEVQPLEPGGVVPVPLHVHPHVGGIDLHVRDGEGLAIQSERLIHRHMAARGGIRRIKAQIEGKRGQHGVRGVVRRGQQVLLQGADGGGSLGFLSVRPLSGDGEGHGKGLRHVLVSVVQGEAQHGSGALPEIRSQDGTCLMGRKLRHLGGEALVPLPLQGEEQIHLLLVHDDIVDRGGNAVYRLALLDGLDIGVLHRG